MVLMTCSWRFLPRPPGIKTFSYTFLSFSGLAVIDHHLVWLSCCLILFALLCRGYRSFLCLFWNELVLPVVSSLSMVGRGSTPLPFRGLRL
ncbi:hypothetical protein TNCV_4875491 [Trichonephila clavipes]|nr:hypothetical protein TNCV_4875491 [Trichonephila clavipes]